MSLRPALTLAMRSTRIAAFRASAPRVLGSVRMMSGHGEGHIQETFEQFTERYTAFFNGVEDLFELQRGLNNCFAHDLVPAPGIIEAALKAARRVDDYATAVRIFEGVREKVENRQQYDAYLSELEPIRKELGTNYLSLPFPRFLAGLTRNRCQASTPAKSCTPAQRKLLFQNSRINGAHARCGATHCSGVLTLTRFHPTKRCRLCILDPLCFSSRIYAQSQNALPFASQRGC